MNSHEAYELVQANDFCTKHKNLQGDSPFSFVLILVYAFWE